MKRKKYLLDSKVLIALLDQGDQHHQKALSLVEGLSKYESRIFLSDILLNEVLSTFARRCRALEDQQAFKAFVQKFQRAIRHFPILCLYQSLPQSYKPVLSSMVKAKGAKDFHKSLIETFLKESPEIQLVYLS